MPKHPLKTCTHLPPHGDHDWDDVSERSPRGLIGNRYHCPGHPVLSQNPADSVANSIAIGKAFRESYDALQAREEALRELLSYCRTETEAEYNAGEYETITSYQAFAVVAERLAKILDGES